MRPPAWARTARFDDVDAFAAALAGVGGDILPLAGGAYRAEVAVVDLGPLRLMQATVPPQIRRGGASPGEIVIVSRDAAGGVVNQGRPVESGEVALHGDRAEMDCAFHRRTRWASAGFDDGGLTRLGEEWTRALPGTGRTAFLALPEPAHASLAGTIEAAIDAALGTPDLLAHGPAVAGMRESIETAIARAFAGPDAWLEQPRATAARLRTVRAVDGMLRATPARAPSVAEIGGTLGVSARTLYAAFAAVYGCSPHAFLKRRRLAMVRRALLGAAAEDRPLVKTAALDHGFWHLGHFARDYQAMFGEPPGETLRAARGGSRARRDGAAAAAASAPAG